MDQSRKGITTSTAIIVVALVVSAGLLFAVSFNVLRVIDTVVPSSIPLHKVTFNETGSGCGSYGAGPTFKINYVPSWYATLGNITMVQPSNATLPLPNPEGQNSPNFAAISKITFAVPNGSYPYHVSLGQDGTYNGTVIVDGSDVVIQITGPLCG